MLARQFCFLLLLCWQVSSSLGLVVPAATRCRPVEGAPSCVCNSPVGLIDLTKVASFDGTPRFAGLKDSSGSVFDYNPCLPFTKNAGCSNIHVCEENSSYVIADHGTEEIWIDKSGNPFIHYTGTQQREVYVKLVCDSFAADPVVTTTGGNDLIYNFTLRSKYACPSGKVPPSEHSVCEAVEGAPSCVCNTPSGIIDLTKIAFYNGTVRFSAKYGPFLYYYNPCFPMSTGICIFVHGCQSDDKHTYYLGEYGSERMKISGDGEVYLHYLGYNHREMFVYLVCDHTVKGTPILTTTGDSKTTLKYEFSLTSCHACPGGCEN